MRALTWCFVMLCLAIPAISHASGANDDLLARIASRTAQLQKSAGAISKFATTEEMWDYVTRLQDDTALLNSGAVPAGYSTEEWTDTSHTIAQLDIALADQLISGKRLPVQPIPGAQARFVLSSADGSWQPVAIFVPKNYHGAPAPTVVFLHGYHETETDLVGLQLVRNLADETGSIVVAPYGRGYSDFRGVAARDDDDAIAAVQHALHVDTGRMYLAGYSMGGFSVFEVGARHATDWKSILCVSGALVRDMAPNVTSNMWRTSYYFVTGAQDDTVPTSYTQTSAAYLASQGLTVSLYVEPQGGHRLTLLHSAFSRAWLDMHRGSVEPVPDSVKPLAAQIGQIHAPQTAKP